MNKPAKYTFGVYWGRIAIKIPQLLLNSYKNWFAVINLTLLLATALNKKIGDILKLHWLEISPWWSFLFMGILLIWGLMNAIYEDRQELYLVYKANENELEQVKKQLIKNNTYIQLPDAIQKVISEAEALKHSTFGSSLNSALIMIDSNEKFDRLARLLAEYIDIFGKWASSSLGDRVRINEYVNDGFFKRKATIFYLKSIIKNGPDIIDLVIKKDDLDKAIKEILLPR